MFATPLIIYMCLCTVDYSRICVFLSLYQQKLINGKTVKNSVVQRDGGTENEMWFRKLRLRCEIGLLSLKV